MKLTQKEKVLRHLKEVGSITPLDAMREYAIMRLSAIIFNLKDEGYNIKSEIETSKNRFGEKCKFSRYTLVTPEDLDKEGQSMLLKDMFKTFGNIFSKTNNK